MSTKMVLEIRYLNSTEANVHLDVMLLVNGSVDCYSNMEWIKRHGAIAPLTGVGIQLEAQLQTVSGIEVMWGKYGLLVNVPKAYDLINTLYEVMNVIRDVVDEDIEFGTTLGKDAFTRPKFILNPTREQFHANIERMLAELRKHSTRDIAEARSLIGRLNSLVRRAESSTKSTALR